ncbi:hypothetical protein [Chromatocurvus halotolerans]|uniref:Big-1 domain-containing protein n=1 Tax=Chromatocurvus halotolerans TaxID=1132028 RepID=A0A4R2KT86_9GAMM|nr:hypothetical protein [Chromatocurvus halotolerans]TCO75977.1 hypothetical protein EV688_106168 [Chromatocurvus halotolerans]
MSHRVAFFASRFAAAAILFALAACGGGGSGGGGFIPGEPGADLLNYRMSTAVIDQDDNPTSLVTSTRPVTLEVTVLEDTRAGAPASGVLVTAQAQFVEILPANGQARTDSDGIARFEIQAGATLGADTVTVTAEAPRGPVSVDTVVDVQAAGLSIGYFEGNSFINGEIGLSAENLPFRGSSVLTVTIVDEQGEAVSTVEEVRFRSVCSNAGRATFREFDDEGSGSSSLTVEAPNGLASVEYRAGSCEAEDVITARLLGNGREATANVTIADRDANFIGFIRSEPSEGEEGSDRTIIAIKGTGGPGRTEIATVTFEVLEESVALGEDEPGPGDPAYLNNPARRPLSGIPVSFELTSSLGDTTLLNTSAVSDADGLVSVELRSGNVATSTRIVASFEAQSSNGTLRPQSVLSNQIVIGTGLPDQNSISLSTEFFNVPRAADVDGVEVAITVRMADKFNNPVADGTSAIFTTEYGAIDSSCLTGQSNGARYQRLRDTEAPLRGTCTVLWISQAPRLPTFNSDRVQTIADDGSFSCGVLNSTFGGPCPQDLGAIRGLRSTVLVTAEGEEFFVDANGNGLYDRGEAFENLPEAFLDHNEDGVYTPTEGPKCGSPSTAENCRLAGAEEEFIDANGDGVYSLNVDPNTGEGVYNGSLCPAQGDGIYCSRDLVNVRADLVLTLSSSPNNLFTRLVRRSGGTGSTVSTARNGNSYDLHIADFYNNAPGAGTTIEFETTGDCGILPEEPVIVPNRGGARGAFTTSFLVQFTGGEEAPDPNNPDQTITVFENGQILVTATDPDSDNGVIIASFGCQAGS